MPDVKKICKKVIGKYNIKHIKYTKEIHKKNDFEEKNSLIKCFLNTKIIKNCENKGMQIKELFEKIDIGVIPKNAMFYYFIDEYKQLYNEDVIIANFAINYKKILQSSLNDYKKMFINCSDEFAKNELEAIEGIEKLIDRTVSELQKQGGSAEIIESIKAIKTKKAIGFRDSLQRILFFNQIIWQTSHFLNGLGRLDSVLEDYYNEDIKNNNLTKEECEKMICEFLNNLHKFYKYKSNSLIGDTGQVIILGGKNLNGEYYCNDLTYMFIDCVRKINLPDPKVLLRVSDTMPRRLMEKSVECIQTGIGCPLLANDDVIIPKLINYGIDEIDAYNYGTSACWEPIILEKSISQNNIATLNYLKPLESILNNEKLSEFKSVEMILDKYKEYIKKDIEGIVNEISDLKFEKDPILSLFIDEAIDRKKDISEGGAVYNFYGVLTVGMANLINSILNIEKFVFNDREYDLTELNEKRKVNFKNDVDLVKKLKNNKRKYGIDNDDIINLTNEIFKYTSKVLEATSKKYNKRIKIGLSSPTYIDQGKLVSASFDGRKGGEPLSVHISSDNSNAYTELIQFASKLDYNENRINGNVIDFLVTPNIIQDNFEKFVDFLLLSIKNGFFEMQLNVISSDILIEAKKSPEKFPNLIVRVWGFSSYFNDLPEEYKDYLIERALKNEGKSY